MIDPNICPHERVVMTSRVIRGGGVQYRQQCLNCGSPIGEFVRRDIALTGQVVPFDADLAERFYAEQRADQTNAREAEKAESRERYSRYLLSEAWRRRREAVLRRDKGLCQGCLQHPASQVHHLTYNHIFDELLYELVSLCDECHGRAHGEGPFNDRN